MMTHEEQPIKEITYLYLGFPGGTVVKNPFTNARDTGDTDSIPESGRSPGVRNGN